MPAQNKSSIRRLLPLWLALLFIAIIFVVAKSGKKPPSTEQTKPEISGLAYVATKAIIPGSYAPELTLYGSLNAQNQVKHISQSSGKIKEILAKNGDFVTQGQKIIIIENEDLNYQLQSSKANLLDIQSRINAQNIQYKSDLEALEIEQSLLKINENALKRQQALVKDGLASNNDLESAQRSVQTQKLTLNNRKLIVEKHQSTLDQLNANQAQIQANINQLQLAVDELTIQAKFDGVINQLNVKQFENINPNQELFTLVNQSNLEIQSYASINNLDLNDLTIGAKAMGIIENSQNKMDANHTIDLTLKSFDQVANQGSIKLTFSAKLNEQIALNRYIKIQLPLKEIENIYAVPTQSVYSNNRIYEVITEETSTDTPYSILKRIDVSVIGKNKDNLLIKINNNEPKEINLLTTRLNDAVNGLKVNSVSFTEESTSQKDL